MPPKGSGRGGKKDDKKCQPEPSEEREELSRSVSKRSRDYADLKDRADRGDPEAIEKLENQRAKRAELSRKYRTDPVNREKINANQRKHNQDVRKDEGLHEERKATSKEWRDHQKELVARGDPDAIARKNKDLERSRKWTKDLQDDPKKRQKDLNRQKEYRRRKRKAKEDEERMTQLAEDLDLELDDLGGYLRQAEEGWRQEGHDPIASRSPRDSRQRSQRGTRQSSPVSPGLLLPAQHQNRERSVLVPEDYETPAGQSRRPEHQVSSQRSKRREDLQKWDHKAAVAAMWAQEEQRKAEEKQKKAEEKHEEKHGKAEEKWKIEEEWKQRQEEERKQREVEDKQWEAEEKAMQKAIRDSQRQISSTGQHNPWPVPPHIQTSNQPSYMSSYTRQADPPYQPYRYQQQSPFQYHDPQQSHPQQSYPRQSYPRQSYPQQSLAQQAYLQSLYQYPSYEEQQRNPNLQPSAYLPQDPPQQANVPMQSHNPAQTAFVQAANVPSHEQYLGLQPERPCEGGRGRQLESDNGTRGDSRKRGKKKK
ncbi:MAG: hypothetical protein Q9191_001224 [Dirinaria sp. TL-2023a]